MKIVIAEDSSTIRRLVAARLAADGYQVIEAADGEEALAVVRSEQPDLLVLDKVMPKLDGFEVVRALRADPQTRSVPIVMLTERTSFTHEVWRLSIRPRSRAKRSSTLARLYTSGMNFSCAARSFRARVRRSVRRTES